MPMSQVIIPHNLHHRKQKHLCASDQKTSDAGPVLLFEIYQTIIYPIIDCTLKLEEMCSTTH